MSDSSFSGWLGDTNDDWTDGKEYSGDDESMAAIAAIDWAEAIAERALEHRQWLEDNFLLEPDLQQSTPRKLSTGIAARKHLPRATSKEKVLVRAGLWCRNELGTYLVLRIDPPDMTVWYVTGKFKHSRHRRPISEFAKYRTVAVAPPPGYVPTRDSSAASADNPGSEAPSKIKDDERPRRIDVPPRRSLRERIDVRETTAQHYWHTQINLRETGDERADRGRLNHVIQTLRSHPGHDRAQLVLETAQGPFIASLPNIRSHEELNRRLLAIIGAAGQVTRELVPRR